MEAWGLVIDTKQSDEPMTIKGTRVMIVRGLNRGAFGIVTHADNDSLRLVTDDGQAVYDRIENVVREKGRMR